MNNLNRMNPSYLKINSVLADLGLAPWLESETPEEVSLRLLGDLNTRSYAEWKKIPVFVRQWYDQCYRQLKESNEVYIYPEIEIKQASGNVSEYLKTALLANQFLFRICELLMTNPMLPEKQVHEVLTLEGYSVTLGQIRTCLKSMKALLGWLHENKFLNHTFFEREQTNGGH